VTRPARVRADLRLFLSYLALIGVTVFALTIGVGFTLRRHLVDMVADDLRRELMLAIALHGQAAAVPPDAFADRLGALSGRRVTLVGRGGRVVGDSDVPASEIPMLEDHSARPEIRAALAGRLGRSVRMSASVGSELLYLAAPAARGEVVRLAVSLDDVAAAVARVQRGILAGCCRWPSASPSPVRCARPRRWRATWPAATCRAGCAPGTATSLGSWARCWTPSPTSCRAAWGSWRASAPRCWR
jgi:hypothetical protein